MAGFVLLVLAGTVFDPGASAQTFAGKSPSASGNNGGQPELVTLSNRSDLVSGGDALVQVVRTRRSVDGSVSLDGTDVTSSSQYARTALTKASSQALRTARTT